MRECVSAKVRKCESAKVMGAGARADDPERDGEPPPSPALPHKRRGGGRCDTFRSGIEFSPLPEERGGRGRGWGTPADAVRCRFEAA